MVLQLMICYYIAVTWFKDGVLGVWRDILDYKYLGVSDYLTNAGLVPAITMSADEQWPAILAASGLHTGLAVTGVVVGNSLKRHKSVLVGFLCGMALALTFMLCLYFYMTHCFINEAGGVRLIARALNFPINAEYSSHYFGMLSALSMTLWVSIPMGVASLDSRDEGMAPAIVSRYIPRVATFYVMSLCFFRFACAPLWNYTGRFSYLASAIEADVVTEIPDPDSFSKLASLTHTLTLTLGIVTCSLLNRLVFALPCSRDRSVENRYPRNVSVLLSLVAVFVIIFFQWVKFALEARVEHVVAFAEIFAGKQAVSEASNESWSTVHSLVLTSYVSWFAFGVLFEQSWEGSATNTKTFKRVSLEGDHLGTTPSLSITAIAALLVFVAIPAAWLGGGLGFIVLAILLQPAPLQARDKMNLPHENPESYKDVNWEEAIKDCPKTDDTYLIIGVGFVGMRLINRLLERGETKIIAFDVVPSNPFSGDPRVTYIQGDVTKPESLKKACQGVDTVITTFALIKFWERLSFQAGISEHVNITGTKNVIQQCKDAGVKILIQTSTSNVMATPALTRKMNGKLMDETCPYVTRAESHNHYSWTKAIAEQLVLKASCPSMLTVAVRPCSGVFGFNDKQMTDRILGARLNPLIFPSATIDWVYVDDVVQGLLKAEARLQKKDQKVAGQAFNIGPVSPRSYEELSICCQHYWGVQGVLNIRLPFRIIWITAYVVEAIHYLSRGKITLRGLNVGLDILTPACLDTGGMNFGTDSSKAKKLLNYSPAWTFEQAVQQSVVQWKAANMAKEKKKSD